MRWDQSEFNAALRKYMSVTPHSIEEVLNKKMLFIARGALRRTPKADRAAIEGSLNVVGYEVSRSKKTGEFKRRRAIVGAPLVFKMINAARRRAGEKGLYGKAMRKAVNKLLATRFRAIGSLKAGWVHPIRLLAARVKDAFLGIEGGLPRVKGRGDANPAEPGWSPSVELKYEVSSGPRGDDKGPRDIDPRVVAALQAAFNDEARSMQQYVIERLQKDADKINARA